MATNTRKRTRSGGSRFQFDLHFVNDEQKEAFKLRLKKIRRHFTPQGRAEIDNMGLMLAMVEVVEREITRQSQHDGSGGDTMNESIAPLKQSFQRDNGIYTGDCEPDDKCLFVSELHAFRDLLNGISKPCSNCGVSCPWIVKSFIQKGHVLRVEFECRRCHHSTRIWSSSRVLAGHYLINQKLVHSFTCAGILPSQYKKYSQFAIMGNVGDSYIKQVYDKCGYIEIVGGAAEQAMVDAVQEVKNLPQYNADEGEWVITDARHDSTANAYHTTVPCLSGNTHKILGISTYSRTEHSIPQTRELACTKAVLPQVRENRGLAIREVAHDIQQQVAKYVKTELGLVNSYDTWHGTKNVAKEMAQISKGLMRERNIKWFPELADKRKSIKVHLYWAMKNCEGSAERLRSLIENIPSHYQGNHNDCPLSSPCRSAGYSPSKDILQNPAAIRKLTDRLKATYIYKYAEDFSRCRDTYWVESFNHMLLIYIPKRIHFSTKTFNMRMNLAVLDWNENVNRPHTSSRKVLDLRRPDRRTPMNVLVEKSFDFVQAIWTEYLRRNKADLQPVVDDSEMDNDVDDDIFIPDGEIVPDDDDYMYYSCDDDDD